MDARGIKCVCASLFVALSSVFFAEAQGQDAASSQPKTKDYGAGFEMFFKLGLPELSGARYVKLDLYSSNTMAQYFYDPSFSGNAWLLKEDKDGASVFILKDGRELEVYDYSHVMKAKQKDVQAKPSSSDGQVVFATQNEDSETRTFGLWHDADLKKDLSKSLQQIAMSDSPNRKLDIGGGLLHGVSLLTAAQAYKLGLNGEANQIADAVFKKSKPPQLAISIAVNLLADAKYNAALDKFFIDGDWNALATRLDALLISFPSGWRAAPAVAKLSALVKRRAAASAPPALSDVPLDEENRALASELAVADSAKLGLRNSFSSEARGLWLFADQRDAKLKNHGELQVIDRIKARGMKAVPLLMALAKDDYLIKGDSANANHNIFNPLDDSGEDAAERILNSMRRPASRSDVALMLLASIVAGEESYDIGRNGRDSVVEKAAAWYASNKDKDELDLAKSYVSDGSQTQRVMAFTYLIQSSSSEKDFSDVEKYLLEAEVGDRFIIESAKRYAIKRGAPAQAFVDKYVKKLKEFEPEQEWERKQINDAIGELTQAVSTRSAKEVIGEIASGSAKFDERLSLLAIKLKSEKRGDVVKLLLSGATEAKSPEIAGRFISYLSTTRGYVRSSSYEQGNSNRQDVSPLPIGDSAGLWKTLLADERLLGGSSELKISEQATMVFESLYLPPESAAARQKASMYLDPLRIRSISKQRVEKALDGVKTSDLPPFPDPDSITEERRNALLTELKALPPKDAASTFAKMSYGELALLIREADKDASLCANFAQEANSIRKVETGDSSLDVLNGAAFDKKAADRVFEILKGFATQGVSVLVEIRRQPCLGGIEISVQKAADGAYVDQRAKMLAAQLKPGDSGVSGILSIPGYFGAAGWPIAKDAASVQRKKASDDLLAEAVNDVDGDMNDAIKQRQTEFWKRLDSFSAGEGNLLRPGSIKFYSLQAPKQQ